MTIKQPRGPAARQVTIAIDILNCADGLTSGGLWTIRLIRNLPIPAGIKPLLWAVKRFSVAVFISTLKGKLAERLENRWSHYTQEWCRSRQRFAIVSSAGFFRFRMAAFCDHSDKYQSPLTAGNPAGSLSRRDIEVRHRYPPTSHLEIPAIDVPISKHDTLRIWRFSMTTSVIQRLRQNALNLIVKDQDVKQLANIVVELCMVCEDQQKRIVELSDELEKVRGVAV